MTVPEVSIVAPAFNEAANIRNFYEAVRRVLTAEASPAEIVFVDDGSGDETAAQVTSHSPSGHPGETGASEPQLRESSRLYCGHPRFVRACSLITMDCDLQHPPEDLPRMLASWRQGAQVVQMVRRRDPDAGYWKRATSRSFQWVLRRLTDVPLLEGAGDFRLLDSKVAQLILRFSDTRPFYRGMTSWLGIPTVCLEYDALPRVQGRSGIGWHKRLRISLDAITALSIRPLRVALLLGLCAVGLSLVYVAVVLVAYLRGHYLAGYPTLIFAVVFLGAVQLISVGVLGEYIGRIYEQSRGLPPYIVTEEDQSED